jgi:F-type H+-transporting ATPase subunit gamma
MANIKSIKRRIKSAQNISQITRAMEMVAASKMKKAQEAAILGKPYAQKILETVRELSHGVDRKLHVLLSHGSPTGRTLVILVSTNKGLCGGLNTNLFRTLTQWFSDTKAIDFVTVGKKGEHFVIRTGRKLVADFSENLPFTVSVSALTKLLVDGFITGTYKEVILAYNEFQTAITQQPKQVKILPLADIIEDTSPDIHQPLGQFLFEPDVRDILDNLLPHYLENQVRSAILEAQASEHSATMIAMKNATEAALDFVDALTLQLNKARQEKITYEIADMVTARMAVE